jgi:hypothetical protein
MKDGDRRIVFVGDQEIGVPPPRAILRLQQFLPAPGRSGLRRPDNREGRGAASPDMTSRRSLLLETQMNFVCPGTGMEYDMKTGECISDRKMKLKKYQVLEKGGRGVCRR